MSPTRKSGRTAGRSPSHARVPSGAGATSPRDPPTLSPARPPAIGMRVSPRGATPAGPAPASRPAPPSRSPAEPEGAGRGSCPPPRPPAPRGWGRTEERAWLLRREPRGERGRAAWPPSGAEPGAGPQTSRLRPAGRGLGRPRVAGRALRSLGVLPGPGWESLKAAGFGIWGQSRRASGRTCSLSSARDEVSRPGQPWVAGRRPELRWRAKPASPSPSSGRSQVWARQAAWHSASAAPGLWSLGS